MAEMTVAEDRQVPLPGYNFQVLKDNVPIGYFVECEGPTIDIEVYECRGTRDDNPRKIPAFARVGDITLRYGYTRSTALWNWVEEVRKGSYANSRKALRSTVRINILDAAGEVAMYWDLLGAFPRRWTAPVLRGMAREVAVGEIVIAFESLTVAEMTAPAAGGA